METMNDLIYRNQAIEALKGLPTWWADSQGFYGDAQPAMEALLIPEDAISSIENLPSAQPEVIRCKDCKWYEVGTVFPCGIREDDNIKEDDFCSWAERPERRVLNG